MTQPVWIRILPDTVAANNLRKTADRDCTQESILCEYDPYNRAYIVPIMMLDWMPGFFEGLVQRQAMTRTAYLHPEQVEVVHEVDLDA